MPRNNMPRGWDPTAPAWQSEWDQQGDPLVAGYFGIQANHPGLLDRWAPAAFSGEHAPFAIERGEHTGRTGLTDFIYVAYWRRSDYLNWWSKHKPWWDDGKRLTEGSGYWREVITMPFHRFETLHLTPEPHGVGISANRLDGPIRKHGYPGAMRDRIPYSEFQDLRSYGSIETRLESWQFDDGMRVVVNPPENMCVIRSGQDWTYCDGRQQTYYLEKLHPLLLEGMRYLREYPLESNCYSLRFVDRKNSFWGPMEQSFGLGYSVDVHAFEEWAKSHSTHIAIFRGYLKMADAFGPENMKLRLWHEVTALPKAGSEFEYINCHPHTGLLPYA